jgi:thymidylate synthase
MNWIKCCFPCQSSKGNEKHEEEQYLDLIRELLARGHQRMDRTGVGTLSLFGRSLRFNLRNDRFPLFTTKKVFWRGVVEELLWFISGSTDVTELSKRGVHIWEANTAQTGHELTAGYGFQWRHSGADYVDKATDYKGQGVDQLSEVVESLRNQPYGRRHIVCSWSPKDLTRMPLPPCHVLFQFYVADGELSCCMYQRSADVGCGVPFNVASYALLTCMIAQVVGLKPGEFVHFMADTHLYLNHVAALSEQATRRPYEFPTLKLNAAITRLEDFRSSDICLKKYQSHPALKLEMAV